MEHPNIEINDVNRTWLKEMMDDVIKANRLGITQQGEDDVAWFIWGAPGIGKTDMVKQLAAEHNMDLVVLNLVPDGVALGLTPLPVVVTELVGRGADEGAVVERELEALILDDFHPCYLVTTPDQLVLQTGQHIHSHLQIPSRNRG